jgi:FlaA1/EpsC-like NDP-sugar epimerase
VRFLRREPPAAHRQRRVSVQGLLQPTGSKRTLFFLAGDLLIFAGSLWFSFLIRFDAAIPRDYRRAIPIYFLIAVGPKIVANAAFRLYHLTWRFVSTRDVIQAFLATLVGSTAFGTGAFFLHEPLHVESLPRSVLVLDFVLSMIGVACLRMAKRIYQVVTLGGRAEGRRVLIVGGGRGGEKLLREIHHDRAGGVRPVGVIDDSPLKHGTYLHGVRVLGGRGLIPRVVKDERVDEVIVAMPSAPGPVIREVVVAARQAGVPSVKILPSVAAMLDGRVTLASVRDVKVEDLLKRPVAEIDMNSVGEYLYGRTVLITGAAGSIGAELARQIANVEPGRLVLLEKDETRLFGLEIDLRRYAPRVPVFPVVGDTRDRARMHQVFRTYQPQVVFHAAAYKHVPMMEAHPQEAVTVNVLGTKVVAEVAAEAGCEMFVQISTDKAVNPTSVMGATKRVAEMVVRRLNETTASRFVAVRFGNVLGSRGSLIPLLEEQIRRGGPITVTHPKMERYFMTIPEAVRLILKASTLGAGGEVFVLDMGEPVLVMELVEALIRLSGLEPDVDVPIQFTGIRPGEKLREEILLAEEGTEATSVEKIFVANLGREPDPDSLERGVALLADAAAEGDPGRIRALLEDLVATYHPVPGGESDETLAELLEGPGGMATGTPAVP